MAPSRSSASTPAAHKVELKADGYEPLQFDVLITPGETTTYKGEMKRIR